jgi:hypothetical protein
MFRQTGSAAGGNTPEDPTAAGNQALTTLLLRNDYLFKIGLMVAVIMVTQHTLRRSTSSTVVTPDRNPNPAEVVKPTLNSPYSGYAVGTQTDPKLQRFCL